MHEDATGLVSLAFAWTSDAEFLRATVSPDFAEEDGKRLAALLAEDAGVFGVSPTPYRSYGRMFWLDNAPLEFEIWEVGALRFRARLARPGEPERHAESVLDGPMPPDGLLLFRVEWSPTGFALQVSAATRPDASGH